MSFIERMTTIVEEKLHEIAIMPGRPVGSIQPGSASGNDVEANSQTDQDSTLRVGFKS